MSHSLPSNKYRDRLGNANITKTARLSMGILNTIQKEPDKGAQLAAVCTVFHTVLHKAGLNIHDALGITSNLINASEGRKPEFKAVDLYIEKELFSEDAY